MIIQLILNLLYLGTSRMIEVYKDGVMMIEVYKQDVTGYLGDSVNNLACDSWSWGRESKPHIGQRADFKKIGYYSTDTIDFLCGFHTLPPM